MKRDARSHADAVIRAAALPLCLLLASLYSDGRAAYSQGGAATPSAAPQSKTGAGEAAWETLSEGGMMVSFPAKPVRRTPTLSDADGALQFTILSFTRPGEAFVLEYHEFPEVTGATKELLDKWRASALDGIKGEFVSERDFVLDGHPGREFVAELPSRKMALVARMHWAKPRLYQIVYFHPRGSRVSADGQRFLDSLKIGKPAAPAN